VSGAVIVLGAGLEGLAGATLLARGGARVTLVEQRATLGGLAAGEEFHPGFRHAGVLHDPGAPRAALARALELERFGLARRAAGATFAAEPDGPGVTLFGAASDTVAALAERSPSDAGAYVRWRAFVARVAPVAEAVLCEPPPVLDPRAPRQYLDLLRRGVSLRRLGEADMLELLRVGPMCAGDWMRDHFELDVLHAALVAPALCGTWLGPWSAGSAALVLARAAGRDADEAVGGPAAVARALEAAARGAGVEVRAGVAPARIEVERGRVAGVTLDDGAHLAAGAVLSTLEPKRTLIGLVPRTALPAELEDEIRPWRTRGTTAKLHVALDGPAPPEHVVTGGSLDGLERAFDAVKYDELSERPTLDVRVPSVGDPRLAPDGAHVLSILVHHAPHALLGGWTDAARDTLEERALAALEEALPGTRARIRAVETLTPADLEQRFGATGGHPHHGEESLDQLLFLRPARTCARYATPLAGLWLGGPGSHPGGLRPGQAGVLAARALIANRR
jgi:phytoene dehydrogenase-like protein